MVAKTLRTIGGVLLCVGGVVFTIIPGSILLILAGLILLSYDYPMARRWLKSAQNMMSVSARKLDRWLLNRR
jgi:drug/metabolite transporter (DMT)-like permease